MQIRWQPELVLQRIAKKLILRELAATIVIEDPFEDVDSEESVDHLLALRGLVSGKEDFSTKGSELDLLGVSTACRQPEVP